jgi:hypothetical protein
MNSHAEIRKLLSAFSGSDLPEQERAMVDEHLKMCDECRSELADLQVTLRTLRTTPEVEPPPWLTTRIMAHVRQQQEQKPGWLKRLFFPLHIKVPLEICAVLCICITGYYLSRQVEQDLHHSSPELQAVLPQVMAPAAVPVPELQERVTLPAPVQSVKKSLQAHSDKAAVQPPPTVASSRPAEKVIPEVPPSITSILPEIDHRTKEPALLESVRKHEVRQYAPPPERGVETQKPLANYGAMEKAIRRSKEMADMAPSAKMAKPLPSPPLLHLEQLNIRLSLTAPHLSPHKIRESLVSAGGTIIIESPATTDRIRARIPVERLDELYKQLEKIGKIIERPPTENRTGTVEVNILW